MESFQHIKSLSWRSSAVKWEWMLRLTAEVCSWLTEWVSPVSPGLTERPATPPAGTVCASGCPGTSWCCGRRRRLCSCSVTSGRLTRRRQGPEPGDTLSRFSSAPNPRWSSCDLQDITGRQMLQLDSTISLPSFSIESLNKRCWEDSWQMNICAGDSSCNYRGAAGKVAARRCWWVGEAACCSWTGWNSVWPSQRAGGGCPRGPLAGGSQWCGHCRRRGTKQSSARVYSGWIFLHTGEQKPLFLV